MTPTDIAEELWRTRKIRVDRRKIDLDVIKRIGRYSIPVHVFEGVTAEVKTLVVPEGGELPPEEELAALEAAERAEAEAAEAAHVEAVRETEAALAEEDALGGPRRSSDAEEPFAEDGEPRPSRRRSDAARARAAELTTRALRGPRVRPHRRSHRPQLGSRRCGRTPEISAASGLGVLDNAAHRVDTCPANWDRTQRTCVLFAWHRALSERRSSGPVELDTSAGDGFDPAP